MRTSTIKPCLSYLLGMTLFLFYLSCGTTDEFDPIAFVVSGQVTTLDGNPIENVEVNSVVDTVFTDENGDYMLNAVETGPIEYRKDGFDVWTELVQGRNEINVSLIANTTGTATRYEQKTVSTTCDNNVVIQLGVVEVSDFGEGSGTITWTNDKVWILKNKIFVNDGQVLTIEPGTIIKGESGQAESAAALIVARGGRIIAEGKAELPIIFTAISDPLVRDVDGNICKSTTLTSDDKGRWGGVIVLGKASLNSHPGETEVEGFSDSLGRGLYGGNDDDDNSGILKYVSIRHGGTQVTINNEINALTMGGVGRGTIIEYCEAYANSDDGFEWFGGTVNSRYLVSAFNEDDAFDYDEGWRGKNQFWLAYQGADADRGGEHDGGTDPETALPLSNPIIANATFWGAGQASGKQAITFRDNAAGAYYNSIFLNYGMGVDIEFLGPAEQDSYQNFANGLLIFQGNILFDIENTSVFTITNQSALPNDNIDVSTARNAVENYFTNVDNGNANTNPNLTSKFIPNAGGAAANNALEIGDNFFIGTNYRGCFTPNEGRWIENWARVANDF